MKQQNILKAAVPTAAAACVLTAIGCALVYHFAPQLFPVSSDVSALCGDVNVDSKITIADPVMLARYCAEDITCGITEDGLSNSDINGDHFVTAEDTSALLHMLAFGKFTPDGKPIINGTTAPAVTDSTESSETVTETTETTTESLAASAETSDTALETTVTEPIEPNPPAESVTVGGISVPLGISAQDLTGIFGTPDEQFEMEYRNSTILYTIFADDPAHTVIMISSDNIVSGFYAICTECALPEGYEATQYIDSHADGTGEQYAVLILREGVSIDVRDLINQSDLYSYAKLNYYAVNGLRAARGIPTLKWSNPGAAVALKFARDIADGEGDASKHLGAGGVPTDQRLLDAGIDWCAFGENLDMGYTDPFAALNGWLRSTKGHRKPILSEKYKNIGIGFVYDADSEYKIYGAQEFFTLFDE
ncbi:MAG: hypothetical protein IK130_08855 [Oscillospiraceae bacterium]|nr:hypothetical protein [Oscillospiraceae bacterium]